MPPIKSIPVDHLDEALKLAERCRAAREPEQAESVCLDILQRDAAHQPALTLLLLARTDLLEKGLPRGVDRAREVLGRLTSEYDRAYYGGLICERQAHYLLSQRGKRTGFVAYDWFRFAMEQYEEAERLDPERPEPILRYNGCQRTLDRNPHCQPSPDDRIEHAIE